ncbi:MAG: thioredoxin family protein [Dehalococcoidia bacterium]
MEPWALQVADEFDEKMAFAEKEVNTDQSARTYRVQGTPTFVLIDASGKEIARFGYQRTEEAFKAAIAQALQKAGA